MSIEERNDRAIQYIHKCYLRTQRNDRRRLRKIQTAIRSLFYTSTAVMAVIALQNTLEVLGR